MCKKCTTCVQVKAGGGGAKIKERVQPLHVQQLSNTETMRGRGGSVPRHVETRPSVERGACSGSPFVMPGCTALHQHAEHQQPRHSSGSRHGMQQRPPTLFLL